MNDNIQKTPKIKRAKYFYSKMVIGEIIIFIVIMIFSIILDLSINPTNPRTVMFVIIFLTPSILVYFLFWYYLRVDLTDLTLFYRFHYYRIDWTDITKISAVMRHQRERKPNNFIGIVIFGLYPYINLTGGVQLEIQTSKKSIKTPFQTLRFRAINRLLHYITDLQKYAIQRIDDEVNEKGRVYHYVKWEIMRPSSSILNEQTKLYLRNESEEELNQSLSWTYRVGLTLLILGLMDLAIIIYNYLLGNFNDFIIIYLMIAIGVGIIAILLSTFSPEARKIKNYQPNY